MDNKGQFLNSKTLVYTFGGAILGFLLFETPESALIGGLIGFGISFIR